MKSNYYSFEGKILIASPKIRDRFFEKSLIYIFMHDKNGVLGIILNYEIGMISNHELLRSCNKNIKNTKHHKLPIMFGGPVDADKIIALSVKNKGTAYSGHLYTTVLHTNIHNFIKNIIIKQDGRARFLLVRGISAWSTHQLESEIDGNSWFIIHPTIDLIFSNKIQNKWDFAIKSLGIENPFFIAPYVGVA